MSRRPKPLNPDASWSSLFGATVRRLRLGITQVPGGRAVFPPLSVLDNLRVYGYALGRDSKAIDEARSGTAVSAA